MARLDRTERSESSKTRDMKSFTITLFATLFLVSVTTSWARPAKKTYSGSYKGRPCTVQMTWSNWDGLGAVDGVIKIVGGTSIPFTGVNSQSGVIELDAGGDSLRLVRSGGATWSGNGLSMTEARPTPSPTPSVTPTPSASPADGIVTTDTGAPEQRMVDELYTGSYRGQEVNVQMRWAPGDEPGIMRRGRGVITMPGGQQVPVEAVQSNPEGAEFNVQYGGGPETYKATKGTRGEAQSWESEGLTLTQKK